MSRQMDFFIWLVYNWQQSFRLIAQDSGREFSCVREKMSC